EERIFFTPVGLAIEDVAAGGTHLPPGRRTRSRHRALALGEADLSLSRGGSLAGADGAGGGRPPPVPERARADEVRRGLILTTRRREGDAGPEHRLTLRRRVRHHLARRLVPRQRLLELNT